MEFGENEMKQIDILENCQVCPLGAVLTGLHGRASRQWANPKVTTVAKYFTNICDVGDRIVTGWDDGTDPDGPWDKFVSRGTVIRSVNSNKRLGYWFRRGIDILKSRM
jgi:hypothetical protein